MKKTFISVLILSVIVLIGCGAIKKPTVVDPCKNAPTECWADKGTDPNTVPMCVELMRCYNWSMSRD